MTLMQSFKAWFLSSSDYLTAKMGKDFFDFGASMRTESWTVRRSEIVQIQIPMKGESI